MAARREWVLLAEGAHSESSTFPPEVLESLSETYGLEIGAVRTASLKGQYRLGLSTSNNMADAEYTLEFRALRRAVASRSFDRPIQPHEVIEIEDRLGWRARLGMYARPWLDQILDAGDKAKPLVPEPRFLIEELLYAVSVTILENHALLDHIEEQELLLAQLRAHVVSLEFELRRKRVSGERVRPSVRFIRSVACWQLSPASQVAAWLSLPTQFLRSLRSCRWRTCSASQLSNPI